MKNTFQNLFLTVGLGTLIFTPMIIIDNGLNDTMKSVLIWLGASILYGFSFSILSMDKVKPIFRIPLHFLACFVITFAVRAGYSYFINGEVHFKKLMIVTAPIFVAVYLILFFYIKYFGNIPSKSSDKEE